MSDLKREPQSDRLTRLEAVVESLSSDVRTLADGVRSISSQQGRPNWNMLGVFSTVVIALVGALLLGPISNNAASISKIEAELQTSIQREIERNNRLEREMGGVLKVDELFQLGKLKLD